ncbi:MAG: serine/threonine-protein kinase [Pirellulales bacterium]
MPGRSGVSTIDSEEFDAFLADFFDWVDRNRSRDVERFLAEREKLAGPDKLVLALRNYLDQTHGIEELAALTTAGWLEARRADGVIVEGSFAGEGEERLPLPAEFGDYELLEELGRGGMGLVYKARQTRLNRIVCVKMILEGRLADDKHVQRFLSEAKAMARLQHPNLVAIYDVGRHQDQYYFSMEYVAGRSLAERIREGPLSAHEAARCVQAVAWAIDYVHANHVLHRDLKPSNILLDEQGQPRVTDFGLARQLDEGSITASGVLLGTPSYMAPEQTQAGTARLDVRCDVYGLGAILYELLAGRPPFLEETPLDTLLAVRTAEPVAPSLLNARLPRDLETISLKCLEKDPGRRYATARAVAEDLGRYLQGEPIQARPISTARRAVRWCRRNPLWFALAATVFLALFSVAGVATTAWLTTAAALAEVEESRDKQFRIARELRRERNSTESHLHLSRTHRVWQAIENGSLAEAEQLLELQVPPAGKSDRRGWEWGYLNSLLRQFELSLAGHSATVHGVAWSPDGRRLASIGADRTLRVWDAAARRELWATDHPDAPLAVAFSPFDDRLATSSVGGTIRIFHAATGALVDELRDGGTVSRAVAWSQNAARIAVAEHDAVIVWDVAARAVTRRLQGHSERVNHVNWSPDGNWIASAGDDGTVRIWNADGDGEQVLQGPGGWVNATAWSADGGRLAAVTQNGELRVWDLVNRIGGGGLSAAEAFTRLAGQSEVLAGVDWSPDGRHLVTGGSSKMLTIWDADGNPLAQLRGHHQAVSGLAWRPDGGRIASASADGTIKIWKAGRQPPGAPLARGASPVRHAAWSPDGRWIAWRDRRHHNRLGCSSEPAATIDRRNSDGGHRRGMASQRHAARPGPGRSGRGVHRAPGPGSITAGWALRTGLDNRLGPGRESAGQWRRRWRRPDLGRPVRPSTADAGRTCARRALPGLEPKWNLVGDGRWRGRTANLGRGDGEIAAQNPSCDYSAQFAGLQPPWPVAGGGDARRAGPLLENLDGRTIAAAARASRGGLVRDLG